MKHPCDEVDNLRGFAIAVLHRIEGMQCGERLERLRTIDFSLELLSAVDEMLTECERLDPQQREELDAELAAAGLPTVGFMENHKRLSRERHLADFLRKDGRRRRRFYLFSNSSSYESDRDTSAGVLIRRYLRQFGESA